MNIVQIFSREEVESNKFSKINEAHKKGVFGVPSYIIKDELFWGREQLPMIKARLTSDYSKLI